MRTSILCIVFLAGPWLLKGYSQSAVSAVSYTIPGQVYSQNFDGLPASGSFTLTGKGPFNLSEYPLNGNNISGWQFYMLGGSNTNAAFSAGNGSSTGNGAYSFGASNAPERALGSLASGTGIYAMGLILTNNTGISLNSFTVSFTAEQWRKGGSGNKNTWTCYYKTGLFAHIDQAGLLKEPNLNFSSVINSVGATALNGNLPENQQIISYTITGANWKNGEQLLLRWDDADEAGNDDACAIDNFSFTATQAASLPSVINNAPSNITARSAILSGTVNDNFSNTAIVFEYDTMPAFLTTNTLFAQPANLPPGAGTTLVTALCNGLNPGVTYFYRIKATNALGTAYGLVFNFTTAIQLPELITHIQEAVSANSAILGGSITFNGGSAITEKGIVWSTNGNPTISNNKIQMGTGTDEFARLINGLPQGTTVFARAYAINTAGTAYGNTIAFTTQTVINSLTTSSPKITNAQTVGFVLKTAQPVSGLSDANFLLLTEGIDSAFISSVSGSGSSFTITVYTGTKDGTIQLLFANDQGIVPGVYNKPYTASGLYTIDKTPPLIHTVSIPDNPMKAGDTITVTISVKPDPGTFKIISGNINGMTLTGLKKKNDSSYTCFCVILNGGKDIAAEEAIPVNLIMADSLGNISAEYTIPIIQPSDLIDANKPVITQLQIPLNAVYKTGDTLTFTAIFSETVIVNTANGVPTIKLTLGSSSKQANYAIGSGTISLSFIYIIQPGDEDSTGIKINPGITLNNGSIKDLHSNNTVTNITVINNGSSIIVDAVSPKISSVTVPQNKIYTTNDTLLFIVNFTEKVKVNPATDTPYLKLTVGSSVKNMLYYKGSGTEHLYFRYIVQKGDLDKNGITLGAFSANASILITDLPGNTSVLALKNTGSLSDVKIDAIAPAFIIPSSETLEICENTAAISLVNALTVNDEEKGEGITWNIYLLTQYGNVSKNSTTALSSGNKTNPGDIFYASQIKENRPDTLLIEASDGINKTTKFIFINKQTSVSNNIISAYPYLCANNTGPVITGSTPNGGNGNYQYIWESSGTNDSASFTKINGTANLLQIIPPAINTSTWFRRKLFSGACTDISSSIKITLVKGSLWSGNTNTDWSNVTNWCNSLLPGPASDVLIPDNTKFSPVITDIAVCHDMTIEDKARLTINGVLQISGNMNAGSGAVAAKKGKLMLSGSMVQNIPAKAFENGLLTSLLINNPAGVFLTDTLYLEGILQLYNGSFQTNDGLIMKNAARIGPSASGTAITGSVSIEHDFPVAKRVYRLIGHPFSNDIALDMIKDSIGISGKEGSDNGFTGTATHLPSAFWYDPFKGNDSISINEGWIPFTNTNGEGENAWKRYSGIRLLAVKNTNHTPESTSPINEKPDNILAESVTLHFKGPVHTGDQEVILQKGKLPGYNLIANPYPCPINLSLLSFGTEVSKNFWIWNTEQGNEGGYTCIPFKSKYILPAFGAFIVKANSTVNNNILFTENCKVNTSGTDSELPIELTDDYYIELKLQSDSIFWDKLLLFNLDSAKNSFDRFDGEKFPNSEVNFYSISKEQKMLSVDARPITNDSHIFLGLQTRTAGTFTIIAAGVHLPPSNTLMLHDKYLNQWMTLEKDNRYTFTTTADTASSGNNRFEIITQRNAGDSVLPVKKITVAVSPVPAKNEIIVRYNSPESGYTFVRIISQTGNTLKVIPLGLQQSGKIILGITDLLPGVYFLEVRSGNESATRKIIKY